VWTNRGRSTTRRPTHGPSSRHPKGSEWVRIGRWSECPCSANGRFMLGASGILRHHVQALLSSATLHWKATGGGRPTGNGEEGWSAAAGTERLPSTPRRAETPRFTRRRRVRRTQRGVTPASLRRRRREIGPQVLRPNGTVFAVGANGPNRYTTPRPARGRPGRSFPSSTGSSTDSAGRRGGSAAERERAREREPGEYLTPTHFFEFDGTNLTQVADPPNRHVPDRRTSGT